MINRTGLNQGVFSLFSVLCMAIVVLPSNSVAEIALGDPALSVEVSSSAGAAVFELPLDEMIWDPSAQALEWDSSSAVELISDEGATLAILESLSFGIKGCSGFALNLRIRAGADDLVVKARSGLLEFPAISADVAQARASAGFSLRDLNLDGAMLYGLEGDGTGAGRFYYNGVPGEGVRFAHLVSMIACGGGGNASASQSNPLVGYAALNREARSLCVEVAFVLSDHDRATASLQYDLEPGPADCGLDSDGDGLPDWLDGCPENPNLTQPGEYGCDDGPNIPGGGVLDPNGVVEPRDPQSPSEPDKDPSLSGDSPGGDQLSGSGPGSPAFGEGGASGVSGIPGSSGDGETISPQQIDQLLGGVGAPCGAGMVGLLPLMILGVSGLKAGFGRRQ